jgi:hypothetical protein
MSNTVHQRAYTTHRHMRVQNRRKAECSAIDQIRELAATTRHVNRLNSYWTQIPEPWDDYMHSSDNEYQNKNYWVKHRQQYNSPHWTRNLINLEVL